MANQSIQELIIGRIILKSTQASKSSCILISQDADSLTILHKTSERTFTHDADNIIILHKSSGNIFTRQKPNSPLIHKIEGEIIARITFNDTSMTTYTTEQPCTLNYNSPTFNNDLNDIIEFLQYTINLRTKQT